MRTVYAKKNGLGLNTSQAKHDANDHGTYASMWKEGAHRLRRTFYFAESEGAFEMRHSCLYFFSLVRISEFLCANFSSTWMCTVYASPQKRPLNRVALASVYRRESFNFIRDQASRPPNNRALPNPFTSKFKFLTSQRAMYKWHSENW